MYYLFKIVIYLSLLISFCLTLISLPFKSNTNNKDKNFFLEALSNEIYINLTLSNPSISSVESNQKIKTVLDISQNSFYLPLTQLSSSKIINDDKWVYVTWAFSMLHFANDTFSFNILSNVINGKNYSKSTKKGIKVFMLEI